MIMWRVVYILWWRQVKKFFRNKSRVFGSLAQPLLMLFAFGAGFSGLYSQAGEGNYMAFLSAGIIGITTMMSSLMGGIDIIRDKQFGFMKECLVSPASRLSIMIGRVFGGATTGLFQGFLVLILCLFVGIDLSAVISFGLALVFMILIAFVFTGLGIVIASLLEDFQGFQLIMNFLVMPLMFISGAMFPLSTSGVVLQTIAKFNPLAYGVDGVRWALTGEAYFSPWLDGGVLLVVMVILFVLGAHFFSKMKADS